jgi:ribosomal protein S18 acetylase RimI-like enzyme
MSVTESSAPVQARGSWPQPIKLRRGWAKGEARRWNATTADATFRLVRGGPGFLEACTDYLLDVGAPSVLSPPLPRSAARTWKTVGYDDFAPLALMRLQLVRQGPTPDHLVSSGPVDLDLLLDIDQAAFDDFWQFDHFGLREAIGATTETTTLTIAGPEGDPVAYAVVGIGHAISYLQRLAVHPDWQGAGMGRSLVRSSIRAALAAGTHAMVLNTQEDNRPAIALYKSEGFVVQPEGLAVLRRK